MSARRKGKSARRKEKKPWVFRTPVGQRFVDVALLVLVIPIAAAAVALAVVAGAVGVASRLGVELGGIGVVGVAVAVVVLVLVFRFRGWPGLDARTGRRRRGAGAISAARCTHAASL